MASQTGKGIRVAYNVEATFNTAPGAGTSTQHRIVSGGLSGKKVLIPSNEIRSDGQTAIARHGSRNVEGAYVSELSVGGFDTIFEAVMRSTWVAATAITVDNTAPNTSFQITQTNEITYVGTTTLLTKGLRVGDVCRFTNMSTAANNNINLRIKTISVSGLVVTVHGNPLTVQGADTAATLTILKKLTRATVPTRRTFYIDEYDQDIDLSEVFGGCRFTGMKLTGTPDGMALAEFSVLGASFTALATGTSPYYTSPTLPTGLPLVFADATVSYNGADIAIATAFELTLAIAAKTEPVIGSTISPDVFDNDARLTGSLSFIRQDLANVTAFANETELELHLLLTEPESEPKDCISIFVPRLKLTGVDKALGGDGAMIQTMPFTAGMKEGAAATGYNDTMLTICTSAA
jgi:tail tube protein